MGSLFFVQELPCCPDNLVLAWQKGFLKGGAGGNGSEGRSDAQDRAVEVVEGLLLDASGNLRADAALFHSFVNDDYAAGFFCRVDDGLHIKRRNRARIDHFDAGAIGGKLLRRRQSGADHVGNGNDG